MSIRNFYAMAPVAAAETTESNKTSPFDTMLTIGDVGRKYGLTLRALRFYEDRGLVTPLRHGASRFYDPEACSRIEAIVTGKKLGLTLGEIATRMNRSAGRDADPAMTAKASEVEREIARLEDKRATIDDAIGVLRSMLAQLETRAVAFQGA